MNKSEAYNKGFAAYWVKALSTDNPYAEGTTEYFDWSNGYRTANYEAAN